MTKHIDNDPLEILIAPPGKIFVWDILYQRFHVCKDTKLRGDEDSNPPIPLLCGKILPEYRATLYSLRVLDTDSVCSNCIEARGKWRPIVNY